MLHNTQLPGFYTFFRTIKAGNLFAEEQGGLEIVLHTKKNFNDKFNFDLSEKNLLSLKLLLLLHLHIFALFLFLMHFFAFKLILTVNLNWDSVLYLAGKRTDRVLYPNSSSVK